MSTAEIIPYPTAGGAKLRPRSKKILLLRRFVIPSLLPTFLQQEQLTTNLQLEHVIDQLVQCPAVMEVLDLASSYFTK